MGFENYVRTLHLRCSSLARLGFWFICGGSLPSSAPLIAHFGPQVIVMGIPTVERAVITKDKGDKYSLLVEGTNVQVRGQEEGQDSFASWSAGLTIFRNPSSLDITQHRKGARRG